MVTLPRRLGMGVRTDFQASQCIPIDPDAAADVRCGPKVYHQQHRVALLILFSPKTGQDMIMVFLEYCFGIWNASLIFFNFSMETT